MKLRSKPAQQILRWVRDHGAPHPGERVGVAVSGGADSAALLLLLLDLQKQLGIVLSVVHLNHQLRGRASSADEKFVAKLAANHRLPFHMGRADVKALAKQNKANLEDTARLARYEFFRRLVTDGQLDRVAVAHTADDQAETVLGHILRGTGLAGLAGIHPVVGHIFRPLLAVRRAELRAYLRAKKQPWREDATNRDTAKMRARIRRRLLPLLEKQFQPAVVEHLATLAGLAREDDAFLAALVKSCYRGTVQRSGRQSIVSISSLLQPNENVFASDSEQFGEHQRPCETPLSGRLVRLIVNELKPRAGQLNADHVRAVLRLAQSGLSGQELQLPGGVGVCREYDRLVFHAASGNENANAPAQSAVEFAHTIELHEPDHVVAVPQLSCAFRFRVIDWPQKTEDTRRTGSALDRDALRAPLVLRNWRPGDQLHPFGHRAAHKLKRLLNRKRIPRGERNGWPVLTSGGDLAWARGFPVAAKFAATEDTRAAVVIVEESIS